MQINEILQTKKYEWVDLIKHQCQQFISESAGLPIVRTLPQINGDFKRVKVRKRKPSNTFADTFNVAFESELVGLRERAIFANSEFIINESPDMFYVFPVDGYKFLYSTEVNDSNENYHGVFESIFDNLGEESAKDMFTALLRFTYVSDRLSEGIAAGAEIILYKIPHYYAVRSSSVESYDELLTNII